MRLLFFGTPDFAVPTLVRLAEHPDHQVVTVVSQPNRPKGRGRKLHPSPVSAEALARELPLLRPERVGEPDVADALRATEPDLGIVVAFGQFLPKRIRELPSRGYLINAHASLLPRHRGAAPIHRAILAGDAETGISVMRVEREMDAGAVESVVRTPIAPGDTGGELTERLSVLAADAIAAALERIAAGRDQWEEQDAGLATEAPKLGSEDQDLPWDEPASALARRIWALAPTPGARCWLDETPLRILAAVPEDAALPGPPGRIQREGDVLRVATGNGALRLERLQRAGGKPLHTDAFLRGRAIEDGTVLRGRPTG
ncbi:MAG: methionyl-tRNA formyltransferase [Myxococcota bacterium]